MTEPVPGTLAEALAALQGQLPRVAKDQTASVTSQRTGKTHTYRYADLLDVTEALFPVMSGLGLSFTACPTMLDGQFVLRYALRHVSGTAFGGFYPLPGSGSPQEIGTAITYARRYALCAVTGLAPGGDDDDAASAEQAHHAQQLPRTGTNADMRAAGRMDRQQKAAHEQLAADTQRDPKRADRSHPRAPDPDDPWAQDAPVDHERAAALRGAALTDPEDKPGTSTLEQQRDIAQTLAKRGIVSREDKLVFCGHVTGRDIGSSRELSVTEVAAVLKAARELEVVDA